MNSHDNHNGDLKAAFENAVSSRKTIPFDEGIEGIDWSRRRLANTSRAALAILVLLTTLGVSAFWEVHEQKTVGYILVGDFGPTATDSDNRIQFDHEFNQILDRIQVKQSASAWVKKGRYGSIKSLDNNALVGGTFSFIGPDAQFEQVVSLRDELMTIETVRNVYIQPIQMEVTRSVASHLLPGAYRESAWAARIGFGQQVDESKLNAVVQSNISTLDEERIQIAMLYDAAKRLSIEISSSDLATFSNRSETKLSDFARELKSLIGDNVIFGAQLSGRIWPDSTNYYAHELNLRQRDIFGDNAGYTHYGYILDENGDDKWSTVYIGLPGTTLEEAEAFALKFRSLPGVESVRVSALTFD